MTMRFRNGPSGYGLVTKTLHWLTVVALAGQFAVGYSMTRADELSEWAVERWLGGEENRLLVVHAGLGVGILLLAGVRVLWPAPTALPPWADGLSEVERRVEYRVEQVLYWTLFLIPATGLCLLFWSGVDWELGGREWTVPWVLADFELLLTAHIAAHMVFFAALLIHVGLVLKHQLVDRDRLLNRML